MNQSPLRSRRAPVGVRFDTVLAEGVWLALAAVALWVRHEAPLASSGFLTVVVVFACAIAFAIVVKDSIVGTKWARRLNVAAVILPLLLLGSLFQFGSHRSTLEGAGIDLRP